MNIIFKSHANCTIRLLIGNDTVFIPPLGTHRLSADVSTLKLTVCPDEASRIAYLSKKAGIILKRFFTVSSCYTVTADREGQVDLFLHSKKGRFGDQYNRVVLSSATVPLTAPLYSIFDEERLRAEFERNEKRGKRALLLFDLFDILGNALTALLLLLIPFALIWIFGDFQTAYTVCGYVFIPIFAVIVILNRVADKYKKKLWRLFKGKALEKSIFKCTDSYFTHEYIYSVFSHK